MKTRLRDQLSPHLDASDLPGLVYALNTPAGTVIDALGSTDINGTRAMTTDTLFRIASLTKPVTGVAVMMLVEDGLLRLDEPVDHLLPELANRRVLTTLTADLDDTVPAERPILVEDLLTCRMGMGAILAPGDFPIVSAMFERGVGVDPWLPDATSGDDWIAALGELPLMRQPGTTWMYDTSFTALGVLIERACGQSLGDFFRDRIFAPLGMQDTGFHVPDDQLHRLPPCYWRSYRTGAFEIFDPEGKESRFATAPGFASAAGGLVSTAADYLAFARMMLGRGALNGKRLIPEAAYNQLATDHVTEAQKARSPFGPGFWDANGWGYGVAIRRARDRQDPNGIGWDGGYGTTCCWNHDTGSVGLLFSQRLMDSPAAPPHFSAFWSAVAPDFGVSPHE